MATRIRGAFTLLELLVVIAIIILLVALLAPNLRGMRQVATTVKCANNLKRIGEAAGQRRASETRGRIKSLQAFGWQESLLEYMGNRPEMLKCEEDDVLEASGPVAAELAVSPNGTWEGITHYVDFEGPMCMKLSQTQYEAGHPGSGSWDHSYVPDGGNIYWLFFEDIIGGGDLDFNDAYIRVESSDNMTILHPKKGSAGYSFWIVNADTHEDLMSPPGMLSTSDTRQVTIDQTPTSYGMNSNVERLWGGGKILALEYEITIAKDTDAWLTEWPREDDASLPSFARHRGRMNVLFMDGSVVLTPPEKINPGLSESIRSTYWEP